MESTRISGKYMHHPGSPNQVIKYASFLVIYIAPVSLLLFSLPVIGRQRSKNTQKAHTDSIGPLVCITLWFQRHKDDMAPLGTVVQYILAISLCRWVSDTAAAALPGKDAGAGFTSRYSFI